MSEVEGILGFLAMMVVALVLQARGDARSRRTLADWAAGQGMTVRSATRRWIWMGPFWWRASRVQRVYDIITVDGDGGVAHGVACVGGWFTGALTPEVAVEWSYRSTER